MSAPVDPPTETFAPNDPRGQFALSFDLELAWGSIENGSWRLLEQRGIFQQTRAALRQLLAAMDEFDIPCTWGVVGCLAAAPASRDLDHLPTDLRQDVQEAVRSTKADSLDGRDLVDSIANANTRHVFCSHTYSHTRFDYPGVNSGFIARELELFWKSLPAGLNMSPAMIFPQNKEAFHAELVAAGFRNCRGQRPSFDPATRGIATKISELFTLPPASVLDHPLPDLARESDSLLFNTGRQRWKLPFVAGRANRGVRTHAARGQIFHVWTHPFDLAGDEPLLQGMIKLLRLVAELRDKDQLSIRTL